jgi:hypothetical protein
MDDFAITSQTDGALVIAALYNLDSHGKLLTSSANSIISSVVSYGYSVANSTCTQNFVIDQTSSLQCDDDVQGSNVAQNTNCIKCKDIVNQIFEMRGKLDRDAHDLNSNYVIPTLKKEAKAIIDGSLTSGNDGVCQYVCMQCVAKNIRQNIQMHIDQSCDVTNKNFVSAFTSGMSYQAEYELTKHQNALKETGYDIKTQDHIKSLAIQMSDTITEMTSNKLLTNLHVNALALQSVSIEPGSTSVVIQNVSQSLSISMMTSLASKTYNDTQVQNSIQYSITGKNVEAQTRFNDLLKELELTVNTLSQLLLSLVGKIIVIVIVLLSMVLVIFFAVFFYKPELLFGK